MLQLIARRLVGSALILLGVAAITFVLLYLLPADPAVQLAGRSATAQTVANIRHELGLDQPLAVQFVNYLGKLAAGRSRPLLHPEDRGRHSDHGAASRDADPDGGGHRRGGCRSA